VSQVGILRNLIFNPNNRIALFRPSVTQAIDITKVIRNWFHLPAIIALLTEEPLCRDIIEVVGKEKNLKWQFKTNQAPKEGNLDAWGMSGLTGYHYDIGVVCDIVTIDDRTSKAKRDKTKAFIRELLNNVMDLDANLLMEGTPWHIEDAWSEWPPDFKVDIYQSGLRTDEQIERLKNGYVRNSDGIYVPGLTKVEFGCNQELIHLCSEDQIFANPSYDDFKITKKPAYMHVDGKYDGDHTGAITLVQQRSDGRWAGKGWVIEDHIDNHLDFIIAQCLLHNVRWLRMETNADKGYLIKELKKKAREKRCKTLFKGYAESTNKHVKIQSFGKKHWGDIVWDKLMSKTSNWRQGGNAPNGHDYINQIIMYMDGEDLNDAPDSYASLMRELLDDKHTGLW
jgi:hypothetical protein